MPPPAQGQYGRMVFVKTDDDKAVHRGAPQRTGERALHRWHQQHGVVVAIADVPDAPQQAGKERVGEQLGNLLRHQQAQHVGALGDQPARGGIGIVAEFLGGGVNAGERLFRDMARVIEGKGDGGAGNPRHFGNIGNVRHGAPCLGLVNQFTCHNNSTWHPCQYTRQGCAHLKIVVWHAPPFHTARCVVGAPAGHTANHRPSRGGDPPFATISGALGKTVCASAWHGRRVGQDTH